MLFSTLYPPPGKEETKCTTVDLNRLFTWHTVFPPASIVSDPRLVLDTRLVLELRFFFGRHTAVLLITQYARMTQCTTVLPGDVQLVLWYSPLDPPPCF